MTDPLREVVLAFFDFYEMTAETYPEMGIPEKKLWDLTHAAPPSEEADKLAWFSASANAALATPPSGLDRPLRARIDAWKRDGAPNEKSLAAFGLALIDATPPSEEATECEGCYHDPHVALCPGPTADGSACPCDTLTNVSPLRETETDAHHVHVGEHCLTCVRHGVALALATPPWTSAAGVLRGKVWPAGQWCTCETHHATGCTAASDGGREHATPLSEEATDVRYHDPSVCGFSSAHISTDPKVHTTAEERLSPPSEEAMSITSHVTVGQCSCGEHHGATPPFEEAPGHVHEWEDAPDDETAWYCPGCGITEYPITEYPHYENRRRVESYLKERRTPPSEEAIGPEIVVLCGSTRFYDMFQAANYDLTMAGKIVLSVGFYPHSKATHGHGEGVGHDSSEKVALDELHKRKIDLANRVYVLNVDGYIGESTRSEIDYAIAHGKPVDYLEPNTSSDGGRE